MKKILLFISIIVASVFVSNTPSLAITGEHISQFDIKTTITRDNKARTVETIMYDFGATYRHGIYRDIPIDYKDGKTNYYLNFDLVSVTDENNKKLETETSTENGVKRIRIGDPDKTITGIHTYVISYTLSPIILEKDGSAFLNLDVIGEWTVPIGSVSAKVELEDGTALKNVSWYGAPNASSNAQSFQTDLLGTGRQVTINATLPAGYLRGPYLEPNKLRTEDIIANSLFVIIGTIVAAGTIAALTIFIIRSSRTRARRQAQIVVAQYEPPTGMTPAHIGLLLDDTASNSEITATIIDWAVAGYMKIEYIPKKGLFSSKDYRLIKTSEAARMSVAEKQLFDAVFEEADDQQSILLSQLPKLTVASAATVFKNSLKSDLTAQGYYDKDGNILNVGELTDAGAKQWALVDGFRLYLSVVEKDRLKFTDAPEKTPERFSQLLPYAVALGVEKEWAKQFEGIDLTQSTTWYSGNLAAFSAVSLASDLGSGLAQAVASSSSASSGGGSSGGGFGGGGGGSW
jgi:uncharacterized membrane protein